MFDELKNTAKQTSIYSLGNLLPKLVGFLLLPLYTDHLTTAQYGILAILQATGFVLIGIFSFNLHTAMLRWLAQDKDEVSQKSIVFTTLISTVLIVGMLQAILLPFSSQFSNVFFDNDTFSDYFVILFLSSGFGILNNIPLSLIRFKEKPVYYIVLTTIKFSVILLLNIYFIAILNMGVEGIILSELIGNILLMIVASRFIVSNMQLKFNFPVLKEMFGYGFPLIFSTTFSLALTLGDRYIIKILLDDSSVGVYSLGHKIASIINVFIIQSFQLGFLPIAFKKFGEPNANRFYSKILTYFVFLLVLSAICLSFFGKELIRFMSDNASYWDAYSIIPVISLAFVFKGIQYVVSLGFHYTKKTSYNAYIVMVTSIVNVSLNFLLIPVLGYFGAGLSMLGSLILMVVLTYIYSQRLYKINYEIYKIAILIIVGLALYIVSLILPDINTVVNIIIKTVLIIIFPVILYVAKFYEPAELEKIKNMLHSKD
jgi:O-antigen/teichoic acid export membrane protein